MTDQSCAEKSSKILGASQVEADALGADFGVPTTASDGCAAIEETIGFDVARRYLDDPSIAAFLERVAGLEQELRRRADENARRPYRPALERAEALLCRSRNWFHNLFPLLGAACVSLGQRILSALNAAGMFARWLRQHAINFYWTMRKAALWLLRQGAKGSRVLRRGVISSFALSGADPTHAESRTQATADGKRESATSALSWFFIGDTIDWLQSHERITGVGRVSCELFLASLAEEKDDPFLPCVAAATPCGLAATSCVETLRFLSGRVGTHGVLAPFAAAEGRAPSPIAELCPTRGEHVLFTGVIWNRHYRDLFLKLVEHGVRFSVLLHDIIPIEEPDLVGEDNRNQFIDWLRTTVAFAQIIYVSGPHVRDQLARWAVLSGCDVLAEVVVITFGLNEAPPVIAGEAELLPASVDRTGFVLSVGTIDKRKNQTVLCRLWARLLRECGEEKLPQLVLAGRDDLDLASAREDFASLVAAKKILILQGLPDEALFALYRTCLFTVFPSLSEGYGLPVAESLGFGKLCIAADLPAIRAHAGGLPWYFDPTDDEAALKALRDAILHPEKRSEASRRIAETYRPGRWAATFEAIAEALGRGPLPLSDSLRGALRAELSFVKPICVSAALAAAGKWCVARDPEVSILIVNWNAAEMTLECVRQIFANSSDVRYEIIIVDNGSAAQDLARLRLLAEVDGVRLIALGCNRYFGEANNIAAEQAKGRYLFLLNNDAFVQPGWLRALIDALEERPDIGGVGPLFLFPDGRVQEAGAVVDARGYPVRLGRDGERDSSEAKTSRQVDYVSAAAFMLPRELFLALGGYDLTYEPAYYEDTDLCFKLHGLGKKIIFCPEAVVIHIEGASANDDAAARTRRKALGDLNRGKFVARWGSYLRSRNPDDANAVAAELIPPAPRRQRWDADGKPARRTAVVYTPFALTPGGGERYILTLAWALTQDFAVTIATEQPYSRLRLNALAREFGLDLSECALADGDALSRMAQPDLMVTLGNNVVPPIRCFGKHGAYMCQFPFWLPREQIAKFRDLLAGYDMFLVNSAYTRAHVFTALSINQLPPLPIEILYPPVPRLAGTANKKKNIILSVGRFFEGGHNKRHDVLIKAFQQLAEISETKIELHLVGSSMPVPHHMAYLGRLQNMAESLDVFFHVNATAAELSELYRDAALYWHATGLDIDLEKDPAAAEHFGISIVEAMSAACVPLAFNGGGPREIIRHGGSGFLYSSVEELVRFSADLLKPENLVARQTIGEAASLRAAAFSVDTFAANVRELAAAALDAPAP